VGKYECKSEIYMITKLTLATASGKIRVIFWSYFSAKQTAENEKEVLRLTTCGVLWRNKQALGSVIIIIGMSHETQIHNIIQSVIIMIGVLLGEKKFNEKAM